MVVCMYVHTLRCRFSTRSDGHSSSSVENLLKFACIVYYLLYVACSYHALCSYCDFVAWAPHRECHKVGRTRFIAPEMSTIQVPTLQVSL